MTTWTGRTSPSTAWLPRFWAANPGYLLLEDGFYLLQENGDKIILDDGPESIITSWTTRTVPTTSWTARIPA